MVFAMNFGRVFGFEARGTSRMGGIELMCFERW